jgi:hypothetical protein
MTTKITQGEGLDLKPNYLIQSNYGKEVRFIPWWSDGIREFISIFSPVALFIIKYKK